MDFIPDYTRIEAVLHNRRPGRLPLYEHHIDIPFIEKLRGKTITIEGRQFADFENYYRQVTSFWKEMTYDAFDYEAAVCDLYPGHGAITGGMLGPIQTRDDFNKYPFDEISGVFWETYTPHLVGYESRATLQYTDPDLFADLFGRIGDLYMEFWTEMCSRYGDIFVFFRMGDDLGFKTSTLLEPDTIRRHILPQYKRVIDIVHRSGKKFLLHSC